MSPQVPCKSKGQYRIVSYCLHFVVVVVIVDWDGLPVWCGVYWFFHGWRHVRDGEFCVERMVCYIPGCICCGSENFGLGSAWWLCWTCCFLKFASQSSFRWPPLLCSANGRWIEKSKCGAMVEWYWQGENGVSCTNVLWCLNNIRA